MRNRLMAVLVLGLVSIVQAQNVRPPLPDDREVWNRTYAEMLRDESFRPNAFLTKITEGKKPGTALDIAMGQGRNALMLAERGWDVTGFDISDLAIETAKADAQKLGLLWLSTQRLRETCGRRGALHQAQRIIGGGRVSPRYLRGWLRDHELLRFSPDMTILYYEDAIGQPDTTWGPGKDVRFVRLVARKDGSK